MRTRWLVMASLIVGCGGAQSAGPAGAGDGPEPDVVAPVEEIDPQPCEIDADCMIGTPRDCCTSFCPEDREPWSRERWAAYQADCAVEECASSETLACRDEPLPPMEARCIERRCVLRAP